MSNFYRSFNGVLLPGVLRPDGAQMGGDLGEQELPRLDGAIVQAVRRQGQTLSFQGEMTAPSADALQTLVDTLRASLTTSAPAPLYVGRDDRFYLAQFKSCRVSYESGAWYGVLAIVALEFYAGDNDAYGASAGVPVTTTITGIAGTVTPSGNSTTYPTYSLTIGTAGTGTITLANTTTGQSLVLSGAFASGDVIVLTASPSGYGVTRNGARAPGLIASGRIPLLLPTANVLTLALTTVTVSASSLTYAPRWV